MTDPESVLTGSGIAARETTAIRVPRARRVRVRVIEMLLGNLITYTSLAGLLGSAACTSYRI
jgi:hypothetical protein